MAGLFLVRDQPGVAVQLAAAQAEFARQGMVGPTPFRIPGWCGLHWSYAVGGPQTMLVDGDDLVAVAGTLVFDGLTGRRALAALLAAMATPDPDWSRLGGQFVALVRRNGRSYVFTDYFAACQLFCDTQRSVFSTALLAAVGTLPSVRFAAQGLYEFAFNVTALGDDTVFEDVGTLGPYRLIELTSRGTLVHPLAKPLPAARREVEPRDRIERNRAALDAIIAPHVREHGDHIHCPLSGGLDSRLLLAGLTSAGATPSVYVYGPAASADVTVARAIGAALRFPVEWTDKTAGGIEPDAFAEMVGRNFHESDGLPNFGNIFDNGGNLAARDARHAGGALAASGGCGEIYRDFFYLPDRPTRASAVARTFFARFDRRDATQMFDPGDFVERIRTKILDALDLPHDDVPLPRAVVDQIYPRVRCRALFGREISLESRQSPYLMPFLDHHVVAEATMLPMRERTAGRFEAALLNAIDPRLAAQPSAYGHSFAVPPSRRHLWEEWSSRVRPVWVRQNTYALKRRLRPMGDEHGGLLGREWLGLVLDPDLPRMRRWFHIDRITDSGLMRRLACLEYLAQYLGSRLAD